jgi:VWFA-related protein
MQNRAKGEGRRAKGPEKLTLSYAWMALRFSVFVLLPFAFCLSSFSLDARAQTTETVETMKVDTNLVDLNVSVFNRVAKGSVGDLREQDFTVLEDGEPQEIKFFASAEAPFDLVLLLDLSGSTADKLDLIRKSAQRFVDAARPTDRIGIVTFTATTQVVSPLTSDRAELKKRIKEIKRLGGGTNFWDALRFVLEHVVDTASAPSPNTRRAVVLMTDGVDNALPDVAGPGSETSFDELLLMVSRSDAITLPIYLDTEEKEVKMHRAPASAYVISRGQLAQLAAESGSIVYRARKVKDLEGVYEQVIRDLGTVYSIGYQPSKKERDGAWRTVSVQLKGHPELAARTKHGYYARASMK